MMPPRKIMLTMSQKVSVYETMAESIVEAFGGSKDFSEACSNINAGQPLTKIKGFDHASRTLFLFARQRRSFMEAIKQVASSSSMDDLKYVTHLVHGEFPTMPEKDIAAAYKTLCEKSDFDGVPRRIINHSYIVQNHIVLKVVGLIIDRVNTMSANKSNGWAILNNPVVNKPAKNIEKLKYITIVL